MPISIDEKQEIEGSPKELAERFGYQEPAKFVKDIRINRR